MSLRGFGGLQNLPVTAIPVFGTTLTAAAVINPDLFSGQIGTGGSRSSSVLSVAAGTGSRFRTGDKVAIGTSAQFQQANTTQVDGGTVSASTANTITVVGLQRSHASGEFVVLAMTCAAFSIHIVTASNTAYIGEDGTVGAGSQTLIDQYSAAGTFQYGVSNIADALDTQHIWLGGGPGVQFIPSFLTV